MSPRMPLVRCLPSGCRARCQPITLLLLAVVTALIQPVEARAETPPFWVISWPDAGNRYDEGPEGHFTNADSTVAVHRVLGDLVVAALYGDGHFALGLGWTSSNYLGLLTIRLFREPGITYVSGRRIDLSQHDAPDMKVWADESRQFLYGWSYDTDEIPGRTLLRLTGTIANAGDGPVEIRGGVTYPDETQDVYQRLYRKDGGYTDFRVGRFVHHESHGHIHFDDYAIYRLRSILPNGLPGPTVVESDKVSFCLLDVVQYESGHPSRYRSCGQLQGISVGWADVYDKRLPDQWIDVTDVAAGEYFLEVEIDPDNRLVESDETNNSERIRITHTPPGQ